MYASWVRRCLVSVRSLWVSSSLWFLSCRSSVHWSNFCLLSVNKSIICQHKHNLSDTSLIVMTSQTLTSRSWQDLYTQKSRSRMDLKDAHIFELLLHSSDPLCVLRNLLFLRHQFTVYIPVNGQIEFWIITSNQTKNNS